jgi:hypothetical protein
MVVVAGLTLTGVPLVAARLPGVIMPAPFEKTPVKLELAPAVMVAGLAAKLAIEGVRICCWLVEPPQPAKPAKPTLRAMAQAEYARSRFIIFPVWNRVAR